MDFIIKKRTLRLEGSRRFNLPLVLDIFAECVHVFNFKLCAVVENSCAVPHTVNLMRVHTKEIECVRIGMVIVERSHYKIKSAVLGDEVPGLHIFVGLRESFNIYRAELVSLAVIEYAGLGRVALVADTPGYLKAENVLVAVLVSQICRAVAPVPNELVGGVDATPVEAAEGVVL